MELNIKEVPSPNFWEGRGSQVPIAVVVHIMDGTLEGTDAWFSVTQSGVSAHYGIGLDGTIHQYVQEANTAWANGTHHKPTWPLLKSIDINPNCYTISIEHEGHDLKDAPPGQLETSALLISNICDRWNIPKDREHIIGHYEIDPVRKPNCPASNKTILDKLTAMIMVSAIPKC